LGMEVDVVLRAVAAAGGRLPGPGRILAPAQRAPDANDPRSLVEREALKLALQEPALAGLTFDAVDETVYAHPMHAAIRQGIAAAGGAAGATGGPGWIAAVRDATPHPVAPAVVAALPGAPPPRPPP